MSRKNIPVRTPRGLHDEVVVAARDLGISVAEYLFRISAPGMIKKLNAVASGSLASSTWFHPRSERAVRVRELAVAHSKRQWEVWQELHRLYQQDR